MRTSPKFWSYRLDKGRWGGGRFFGPGEKVGQCPLEGGKGGVPTGVPLLPTLPSHLPPVLVRVIHQHDPVPRPGRTELGSQMERRDLPFLYLNHLGPPRSSARPLPLLGEDS